MGSPIDAVWMEKIQELDYSMVLDLKTPVLMKE